ncbi:hypothetical protein MHU86_22483 [Fragilaria crotonensis]|nr:hypothetical protein MHU86_22483 [Fragilaria crotonensis]
MPRTPLRRRTPFLPINIWCGATHRWSHPVQFHNKRKLLVNIISQPWPLPFRSFFLRQVRTILSTAPSRESLRQLLASADPDVTDEDLDDETIRTRVLKELRKRVHPDKHPNDDTATGIFQDVPPFYEACCRRLHLPVGASSSQNTQPPLRRRSSASESETTIPQTTTTNGSRRSSSTSRGVSLPSEFTVTDKWPYIPLCHPGAPQASILFANSSNDNDNDDNASVLELLLAYQCINARGAVAHRAKPGLFFGWSKVTAEPNGTTAEQLWQKKFRGLVGLEKISTTHQRQQLPMRSRRNS